MEKSMTYYNESVLTGAAANRRTAKKDPMELLVRLRTRHPTGSFEDILSKWKKAVHDDDEYENAVDVYCFRNLWTEIDAAERRKERQKEREEEEKAARAQGEPTPDKQREEAAKAAADAIRQTILWDALMPNGKRFHECTFGYAAEAGGIFSRIGKLGKRTEIIGKKLTREQVEKAAKDLGRE
jgi:hypothetical protein